MNFAESTKMALSSLRTNKMRSALTVLGAAAMALFAGPDALVAAAVGFALYYVAHGAGWPLLSAVLHTRVGAAHRATAVSAMSLAMALGGIVGNVAIAGLVELTSVATALYALAGVLAVSVLAALRLPHSTRDEAAIAAEQHPAPA